MYTGILRPILTRTDILHFFSGLVLDIITEISKEVENNTIGRVNTYEKQYVPRRNGGVGGSYTGGGGVGLRDAADPIFFVPPVLHFLSSLLSDQPYESMTGPIGQRVLT